MRLSIAVAAGIVALSAASFPAHAGQTDRVGGAQAYEHQEVSAAKRKNKRVRGYQAYGSSRQQIACTYLGCNPIPRGCRIVTGRIPFTWDPSGYDDVVCPYYSR